MIADPRRRLVVAAGIASALFAAMPQSHAHAATIEVNDAVVSGSSVSLTLSASGLPGGADPASAVVRVDGVTVRSSLSGASDSPGATRSVVLVVDTSGSMAGAPLTGARAAALSFLRRLVPDVRVGLIGFSDHPRLITAPTTDRTALRRGLASVRAGGETTLYDGIALAVRVAGSRGARQIVVLSDGADTRSRATLRTVEQQVASSGAVLNAIGFRTSASQRSVLGELASAGRGHVSSVAAIDDLASAFAAAAQPLEHLVVTGQLPSSAAGHDVAVEFRILSRDGRVSAMVERTVHVPGLPGPVKGARVGAPPHPASGRGPLVALIALAVGLFLLVLGVDSFARPVASARRRGKLLDGYTTRQPTTRSATARSGAAALHTLMASAGRSLARRGDQAAAELRMDQAGLAISPPEWLVARIAIAIVSGVLAALMTRSVIAFVAVAPICGFLIPRFWLARRIRKRREKFIARLPDALQLVASSLSAGYSLPQALDALVQQGVQPVSDEIGRALTETRLGVPVEDALDNVAVRVADRDFEWTVMAIRIQREVGGNLAEVLTTVGETLRGRASLRRQVKVLSAEGRLSGIILMALPILLALFEFTFRRAYMRPLYTTPIGGAMLVFAITALTIGGAWMRKIVKVEA